MGRRQWGLSPSKKNPGDWVLIGPYDPAFVAALKAAVPASGRQWDPVAKAWKIREGSEDATRTVVERFNDNETAGDDASRDYEAWQ